MKNLELWKTIRPPNSISPNHLLDWFDLSGPPIPILYMVQCLGIKVYFRPNASYDGILNLTLKPDPALILKKELPPPKLRYVAGLALGHLVLKPYEEQIFILSHDDLRPETRPIRIFTQNVLVPDWALNFAHSYMNLSLKDLPALFSIEPSILAQILRRRGYL